MTKPKAGVRNVQTDVEFCMSLIQRELAQQAEDDDPDYQEARNTFDRIRPLLEAAPEMVEQLNEALTAFRWMLARKDDNEVIDFIVNNGEKVADGLMVAIRNAKGGRK